MPNLERRESILQNFLKSVKDARIERNGELVGKVLVIFEDGGKLVTSESNSIKAMMGYRKYSPALKRWLNLTIQEVGNMEKLLYLINDKKQCAVFYTCLRTIINKNPSQFLVDPNSYCAADFEAYRLLSTLKEIPTDISAWCQFIESSFTDPNNTKQLTMKSGALKEENYNNLNQEIENQRPTNFIKQIIEEDLKKGKHQKIITRFPPEPNGFLHLGHAKSICLNFGLAKEFDGICHLRFDDTNPEKEDMRYINSIQEDILWLGGDWKGHLHYTSNYFQQLYEWAVKLIKQGDAYVDHQTEEEVRSARGDVNVPGVNSPFRDRTVEENLILFEDMRLGKVEEGKCILRAKIDMSSGNMNLRDPPIYRVKFHSHPRTGSDWKIYPIYDFAHGQSDSIERITHSICTLEFEDHRPLYEWLQDKLDIFRTRQIEFARLNCTYVVMSKRHLSALVQEGFVEDWDDPRLPTLSGLRRKGYPASAIRDFCNRIGVAKRENVIAYNYLEACVT